MSIGIGAIQGAVALSARELASMPRRISVPWAVAVGPMQVAGALGGADCDGLGLQRQVDHLGQRADPIGPRFSKNLVTALVDLEPRAARVEKAAAIRMAWAVFLMASLKKI